MLTRPARATAATSAAADRAFLAEQKRRTIATGIALSSNTAAAWGKWRHGRIIFKAKAATTTGTTIGATLIRITADATTDGGDIGDGGITAI